MAPTREEIEAKSALLSEELFDSYVASEDKFHSLNEKLIAITGTTSGIGFHIVRCAIAKGARTVLLLNRESSRSTESLTKLQAIADKAAEESDGNAKTELVAVACDLQDMESVKKAAVEVNSIAETHGGLDVLCNNAGIMASPDKRTKDGFDIQMQTNQLSHFLLASLVYDNLVKAADNRGEARIVTQSSSARAATKQLQTEYFEKSDEGGLGGDDAFTILQMMGFAKGPWSRYGQSKLANSVYAMALHDKLQASGSKIKSVCCEPGFSVTPLQTTSGYHGWMEMMEGMMSKQSAADGSLNACMASFSDDAKSGDFYVPEKGLVGPPKKVIEAGAVVPKGKDQPTVDPDNKALVWEACEKACGVEWKI